MKKRLFSSFCLLALVTLLLSSALICWVLYDGFYDDMTREVRQEAAYLEIALDVSQVDSLALLEREPLTSRITLIAPNGQVLFDNKADANAMANHGDRPEVAQALAQGQGEISRASDTLGKQTYYYAIRLAGGNVLRLANTVDTVWASLWGALPFVLLVAAVTFLLAMALAGHQTKRLVQPLNELNLDDPLNNDTYDEISPLLTRIDKQHRLIQAHVAALESRQQEFDAITQNMQEGLILLNNRGNVLSINASAAWMFSQQAAACLDQHILTVCRAPALQALVQQGLAGQAGDVVLALGERQYQLLANPVQVEGAIQGLVLLAVDVTQRQQAEQMRREFSANVSHELKTPLTSISGCAEIMKNGLVKPADIPRFAGMIYKEACRLVTLVEDIINLSKLDEQEIELPKEDVDLLELSKEVCQRLATVAEGRQVALHVYGNPAILYGVRQVLDEMLYNLVDNGIKYNRPGGKVEVKVESTSHGLCLTVRDSGIGIAPDQQERVFERFYRVDKSHSKDTGGTGLGLSIVKHAAAYHGGKIELVSALGKGTTVRILFPW